MPQFFFKKFPKNLHFITLKCRQKSNFQLFSDFLFSKSLLICILSFSKVILPKTCFLLFNYVKTAKNAEFTRKTRITRRNLFFRNFDPKFGISDQTRVRKVLLAFWTSLSILFVAQCYVTDLLSRRKQ